MSENAERTVNFKLLASALELNRANVVDIIQLGGMEVSKNRVDTWFRGKAATKNATGNSELTGTRVNRTNTITSDEFHAFCVGLKPWLQKQVD